MEKCRSLRKDELAKEKEGNYTKRALQKCAQSKLVSPVEGIRSQEQDEQRRDYDDSDEGPDSVVHVDFLEDEDACLLVRSLKQPVTVVGDAITELNKETEQHDD